MLPILPLASQCSPMAQQPSEPGKPLNTVRSGSGLNMLGIGDFHDGLGRSCSNNLCFMAPQSGSSSSSSASLPSSSLSAGGAAQQSKAQAGASDKPCPAI